MSYFSTRLKEERKRMSLTQPVFAELGGVKKGAQVNYELGKRAPDTDYLSALYAHDVDIIYILTGIRTGNSVNEKAATYGDQLITEQKKLIRHLALCSNEDYQAIKRLASYAANAEQQKQQQEKQSQKTPKPPDNHQHD